MKIITAEQLQKIKELAEKGYMDSEIATLLNIKRTTVWYNRKKLNIKTKFTYSKISKIDNSKFEELFNKGLSDYKIAKELNMSPSSIYSHRVRYNYIRKTNLRFNKPILLSDYQKQVLIGTILGDSSFKIGKGSVSPAISCAHGIKQEKYCKYKTHIFENLGAKCKYHKRNKEDKRTHIFYEDYTMYVPANPEFIVYYNAFYKNNKKVIPIQLLDQFTEISLAFMFMDDGTKTNNSYKIATNCFSKKEIEIFSKFLYDKFNIETTIHKDNGLYIKVNSKKLFEYLISPYIIDSMKYKLHSVS